MKIAIFLFTLSVFAHDGSGIRFYPNPKILALKCGALGEKSLLKIDTGARTYFGYAIERSIQIGKEKCDELSQQTEQIQKCSIQIETYYDAFEGVETLSELSLCKN